MPERQAHHFGVRTSHHVMNLKSRTEGWWRVDTLSLFADRSTMGWVAVARAVVDVMPKQEILDPQGQAVQRALGRLGFDGITEVRQGKRFVVEVDGDLTEQRLAEVRQAAETLLANTVIEDFEVRVEAG